MTQRQIDLARRWPKLGILSEEGLGEVRKLAQKVAKIHDERFFFFGNKCGTFPLVTIEPLWMTLSLFENIVMKVKAMPPSNC